MGFKVIITLILSIATITFQDSSVINNNQRNSQPDNSIIGDDDDTIVIEANATQPVRSVDNLNSLINLNVDEDNNNNGVSDFHSFGSCICVPYYLCRKNKTIITDGSDIIDIRFKPPTCNSYLDVCCNTPLDTSEVPTHPTDRYDPNNKNNTAGGGGGVSAGSNGCGRRNFDGAGVRISGAINHEAQFGEFPWMVAVIRVEPINENITMNVYQCGGSLIHPRVILTAAHCVINRGSNLTVRAGEWDTQTKKERYPHEDQHVVQIIVHEKFYSGGLHNDIALLITDKPFTLTDHIDTVCLPPQGLIQNDATCTASGWGKDVFGKNGTYQVILKKVDLPMVPRAECEKQLKKTRLSPYFELHESFVCAGGVAGRDTCKGDGGGPLICPISSEKLPPPYSTRYFQNGIVAWGISCGEDNVPGVYVNVALFKNWIDNWMRQLGFDKKYYTLDL